MTLLADRKNTVMGSDNFSLGDDREMTQLHGHSFDEGALSGATPSWIATLTLVQPSAFKQHLY